MKICGRVVTGKALGRQIGFPTANVELENQVPADSFGVYLCRVILPDAQPRYGVVSVGTKPTVHNDMTANVECYIFDFVGDLYGVEVEIELLDFIRPVMKFKSIEELKEQIGIDVATAKQLIFR